MKQLIGIVIIIIGAVFLLNNLNIIEHDLDNVFSLWPLIIVAFGVKATITGMVSAWKFWKRGKIALGKLLFGLIVIGVGMSFLSTTTEAFYFPRSELWSWTWPVVLIYIGFKLLFDRHSWKRIYVHKDKISGDWDYHEFNSEFIDDRMVGDINIGKQPWKIGEKRMQIGVGDTDVDFTKAILEPGENVFELTGWVGSIEMLIPSDMPVHIECSTRIGDVTVFDEKYSGSAKSVTYTSPDYQEADKKLRIVVQLSIGEVGIHAVD